MLRTALATVVLALCAYAAAHGLTRDFQVWTAEGARRLDVALHPRAAPPIEMDGPDVHGQTLAALLAEQGAVTIADFIYTRCTTLCVALGNVFQQLQASIIDDPAAPGAAPLRLLSISFDPEHDDAAVLGAYAVRLRADPRVWRFARARPADSPRLLGHYQVTVIPDGYGGYQHNAALLVIDQAGRLVRVFDYAEHDVALAYARSLTGADPGR